MNIRSTSHVGRPYVLLEATHRQLLDQPPNIAVLPWGAAEAHNYHLPYGTDIIEATSLAIESARLAYERQAKPIVLPTIPFGNNEQQLDQIATISFRTRTAEAILRDVARSLLAQNMDRLIILNAHGGNTFKPIVRDIQNETGMLIVVIDFFLMLPQVRQQTFEAPGDHADEMETSFMLHVQPELVELSKAGSGEKRAFEIQALNQPGVWTPRPWSASHPDTGSGNPAGATPQKGAAYFKQLTEAIANVIYELSIATPGQHPYKSHA